MLANILQSCRLGKSKQCNGLLPIRQHDYLLDLRCYRLFVHISAALGGFMFAKRANRGAMRNSCYNPPSTFD